MKRKALLGAILFFVIILGGSFLAFAQEVPNVENFLGVKWGKVYTNPEEWIVIGDHAYIGSSQLYKEMKKKGYILGGFKSTGYLQRYYGYVGPYAGDAQAEIQFFFVNNKFYTSEIYCFVYDSDVETKYENVKKLMIEKFGPPTDDYWRITHKGTYPTSPDYTSVGVHWIGKCQQDKIDISCTLLKDNDGKPLTVFIQYMDSDIHMREGKQNEVL
jgi:hypothetical protein